MRCLFALPFALTPLQALPADIALAVEVGRAYLQSQARLNGALMADWSAPLTDEFVLERVANEGVPIRLSTTYLLVAFPDAQHGPGGSYVYFELEPMRFLTPYAMGYVPDLGAAFDAFSEARTRAEKPYLCTCR
jgi:hypothetical protein